MSLRSHSEPPMPSKQSKPRPRARRGRPPGSTMRSLKMKCLSQSPTSGRVSLLAPDMSYTRFTAPISSESTSPIKPMLGSRSLDQTAFWTDTRLAAYGCNEDKAGLHRQLAGIFTQDQSTQCYLPRAPFTSHICGDDSPKVIIFDARLHKLRLVPETRLRGTLLPILALF